MFEFYFQGTLNSICLQLHVTLVAYVWIGDIINNNMSAACLYTSTY